MSWLYMQFLKFLDWLDSFQPCPKEEAGYTCHHRTMSNGQLECGRERNYWQEHGDE